MYVLLDGATNAGDALKKNIKQTSAVENENGIASIGPSGWLRLDGLFDIAAMTIYLGRWMNGAQARDAARHCHCANMTLIGRVLERKNRF